MRNVDLGNGISMGVPGNFPKAVVTDDDRGNRSVSFSMRPHENANRFVSFFEISVTNEKSTPVTEILPPKNHTLGTLSVETLKIPVGEVQLETVDLEISRPCGSKENLTLYMFNHFFSEKKKYLTVVTYSMTRQGLLDVLKSIKCK